MRDLVATKKKTAILLSSLEILSYSQICDFLLITGAIMKKFVAINILCIKYNKCCSVRQDLLSNEPNTPESTPASTAMRQVVNYCA